MLNVSKFYLPPLPQRQLPSASQPGSSSRHARGEERREREKVELDELDLQVERRKEIYKHELFVKVCAIHRILVSNIGR